MTNEANTGRTTWIDQAIGKRLYEIRKQVGITQEELARTLQMSFQQIQKYEKGTNRISASKLFVIAKALQVPYNVFFSGWPNEQSKALLREDQSPYGDQPIQDDEKKEILDFFSEIPSQRARRSMLQGLRELSRCLRS